MKLVVAVALLAACDAKPPLDDCGGDLRGVWRAPGDTASGEPRRFQIIAGPWLWEIYPMFDDGVVAERLEDGVLAAPSTMDVQRFGGPTPALYGTWSRRYERRNRRCVVDRPVVISQCHGDAITVWALPPPPPAHVEGCAEGEPLPAIEWRLTRE